MTDFSNRMRFALTKDGNINWGDEYRNNLMMLDVAVAPKYCYFVSQDFTAANLQRNGIPDDQRHFSTIQGAVTAAESNSYTSRKTVFIWPGDYNEHFVTIGNLSLVGMVGASYRGLGAGYKASIDGNGSSAATITVNPPDGHTTHLGIKNLYIGNSCSSASGFNENGFLIQYNGAGITSPWGHTLLIEDSYLNAQTWAQAYTDWDSAIKTTGEGSVTLKNVLIRGNGYNGNNTGGVQTLIRVLQSGSRTASVIVSRCELNNVYRGNLESNPALIYADGNVSTRVAYTALYGTSTELGGFTYYLGSGNGSQSWTGLLDAEEIARYCNLDSAHLEV